MKKLTLFLSLYSLISQGQVNNKIEGITINAPCEIEYTRNINNQNNYTCNNIKGNTLINYTIHVTNLFNDMNGLNENSLKVYKKTYLKVAKENAEKLKETTKYITLFNRIDALSIIAFLDYSGIKYKNTSIMFIYRNKGYIVNLVSNDLKSSSIKEIIKRIKI